jgi:ribosomal protein S18 acetylase RimI-like enzyme
LAEWSKKELSVKLGSRFVRAFYTQVASSPYSEGFVAILSNQVVAYISVFSDYSAFNSHFVRAKFVSLGLSVVNSLLHKRIKINEVAMLVTDNRKLTNLTEPKHHLGALAVSRSFQSQNRDAIREIMPVLMVKAHQYLAERGARYVWASTDASNLPAALLMKSYDYQRVATISQGERSLWIFEGQVVAIIEQAKSATDH